MPPHVLGDGRLTHRDSQLLQLPMNPRRAPEWIRRGDLTNQRADIVGHGRASGAVSAFPGPEQQEAAAMPCEHRRRLNDVERRAPAAPSVRQPYPQHTINSRQTNAWTAGTIRNRQLVAKCEDLQVPRRARTNQEPQRLEQRNDDTHDESSHSEWPAGSIAATCTAFLIATAARSIHHSQLMHERQSQVEPI
jgi:hypothetical protein